MKKVLLTFLSLLLVFLMVPVVPDAAYADDASAYDEALIKALQSGNDFFGNVTASKVPGAPGIKSPGAKAPLTPVEIKTNSFHDSTLPDNGWIALDADGDGHTWLYARDYSPTFLSLSGTDGECISSASYINDIGALTPDNWLISPAVQMPAGKQLNFYVIGQDRNDFAEHYGVYVSTTSQTDPSTFTELYTGTVTNGANAGFEVHSVDLSAYAGKTVYLAFRHFDCTDQFWLDLDGVGLGNAGETPPPVPPSIIRVKGSDRYATSIAVAEQLLKDAGATQFPNAIIATGDDFPDALAGSSLSTAVGAPILLVSSKKPSSIDDAMAFIKDYVKPSGVVVILGGKAAVPESVESRLMALGYGPADSYPGFLLRLAGKNRYETNLEVLYVLANSISFPKIMLICDGTNWPDAATASAVGLPIMLISKAGLNDDQKSCLDFLADEYEIAVDVIGGKGAISEEMLQTLDPYDPIRVAGANRAETAVAVADHYFGSDPKRVTFAYGGNFPDCISGGFLARYMEAPILYGDSKVPKPYADADAPYIAYCGAYSAYVLGGASLISDQFVTDLLIVNAPS